MAMGRYLCGVALESANVGENGGNEVPVDESSQASGETDSEPLDALEELSKSLQGSDQTVQLSRDSDLANLDKNDSDSLREHNESYGSILKNYTDHVSETLKSKRKMKFWFFVVALITMSITAVAIIFCAIFIMCNVQNENFAFQDYIVPMVSALVSFMTTFIVIPKIIAEYLFNSNEDSVMKDIVSSIQSYDKAVRENLQKSSSHRNAR